MFNYKTIILFLIGIIIFSCKKWEPLPELEPRSFPPPPPIVYPYGNKQVVKLDSFRLDPWPGGGPGSFILSSYLGVNDSIIHLYEPQYIGITVYENNLIFRYLAYPVKTFTNVVNSGQVLKYNYRIKTSNGDYSLSSRVYTITVP